MVRYPLFFLAHCFLPSSCFRCHVIHIQIGVKYFTVEGWSGWLWSLVLRFLICLVLRGSAYWSINRSLIKTYRWAFVWWRTGAIKPIESAVASHQYKINHTAGVTEAFRPYMESVADSLDGGIGRNSSIQSPPLSSKSFDIYAKPPWLTRHHSTF